MFKLGGYKAPGLDRFPLSFYQKFWEIVKNNLLLIFQELYEGRFSTRAIDYKYVCLIPKIEEAARAHDFRPISLLNRIQKIISKVLANRLEGVMLDLISLHN